MTTLRISTFSFEAFVVSITGILVVRANNDPSRDMKDADIARAMVRLESAGVPIVNEFHILNHWR